MKTNKKWIRVTYAIATIIIVVGLVLRLFDYKDGYAISIIGTMIGLIAFIITNIKKRNSVEE